MSEKHVVNTTSGWNDSTVDSFLMVGPTLALAKMGNKVKVLGWKALGMTLEVHDGVTDVKIIEAFKQHLQEMPILIHVTLQGLAHITHSTPVAIMDEFVCENDADSDDEDQITVHDFSIYADDDIESNAKEDGFTVSAYPNGPTATDIADMSLGEAEEDEDELLDFGHAKSMFYAFSWIELIEADEHLAKLEEARDKAEEEEEDDDEEEDED